MHADRYRSYLPSSSPMLTRGRSRLTGQYGVTNEGRCKKCDYDDDERIGESLHCDGCNDNYHASCVGLEGVPEGDWFCESCTMSGRCDVFKKLPDEIREAFHELEVDTPRPPYQGTRVTIRDNMKTLFDRTVLGRYVTLP